MRIFAGTYRFVSIRPVRAYRHRLVTMMSETVHPTAQRVLDYWSRCVASFFPDSFLGSKERRRLIDSR